MSYLWRGVLCEIPLVMHVSWIIFQYYIFIDTQHFQAYRVKFCMSCGFDLSLNNAKIEPPLQRSASYEIYLFFKLFVEFAIFVIWYL